MDCFLTIHQSEEYQYDFDIDFCIEGRDKVIEYVQNKYGGGQWRKKVLLAQWLLEE